MKLKDTVVLVSGASRGIGAATAVAFAQEGASIIINYSKDQKGAEAVLKACSTYSQHHLLQQTDITDETQVKAMFAAIKKKYTRLDVLVNCAGIFIEGDSPTNLPVFTQIYEHNFLGAVTVTKYALSMLKQGKIINVSSINGRLGQGGGSEIAYSAMKAALENYTKNLAKSLAPNILVNAVAPGRVATAMWGNPDAKEQLKLGQAHLIKRMIQPEEIASAIIFLAKNDAMCGEIVTIDGGNSLMQ